MNTQRRKKRLGVGKKDGRPKDDPEKKFDLKQVFKLGELGLTDEELGNFYHVGERTITEWKKRYPNFAAALKDGKDHSDNQVVKSLYKRANGYKTTEVTKERRVVNGQRGKQAKYEIVVTKVVEKELAPDTLAGMFWMQNRRRATYRRQEEKGAGSQMSEQEIKALKEVTQKLMENNS